MGSAVFFVLLRMLLKIQKRSVGSFVDERVSVGVGLGAGGDAIASGN